MLPDLVYHVTQDLIDGYGMASLDLNPVHMDPGWSARAQVFDTPMTVAHGMMSMSFMTSLIYRAFGAMADICLVDSKFTKPVPVGSTVTVRGMVRDVHPLGNGEDYAAVNVDAIDQGGDIVGVSEIHVRLPRKQGVRP
jgi:phosphate acetyltransferase